MTKTVSSTAQAQRHLYPGIPYANRGEVRAGLTAIKLGRRDLASITAGFVISILYASVANPVVPSALFP